MRPGWGPCIGRFAAPLNRFASSYRAQGRIMTEETVIGIDPLLQEGLGEVQRASDLVALDQVRVRYLGKAGILTARLKQLGALPKEERPRAGQSGDSCRCPSCGQPWGWPPRWSWFWSSARCGCRLPSRLDPLRCAAQPNLLFSSRIRSRFHRVVGPPSTAVTPGHTPSAKVWKRIANSSRRPS